MYVFYVKLSFCGRGELLLPSIFGIHGTVYEKIEGTSLQMPINHLVHGG
jgi:hypothetical protein